MIHDSKNVKSRQYDYVIVGAGPSAMGILYGLLESHLAAVRDDGDSDDTPVSKLPFSVAIVERGVGPPHDPLTKDPHRWYEAAHDRHSSSVRLFSSTITGRRIDLPVGQGLGGTSNINACLCLSPLSEDLETWPEPWRSSLVEDAGHLMSHLELNGSLQFGSGFPADDNPFVSSISSSMIGKVPTLASRDVATGCYVRNNYYSGLVEPLLRRYPRLEESITWFRGVEVQRLIFDDTQVTGVECMNLEDASLFILHATRRTILCAGAIETPALLLVSGLGEDQRLSGIGKHLKDQALLARAHLRLPSIVFWRVYNKDPPQKSVSGIAALGHWRPSTCNSIFQIAVADSVSLPFILPGVAGMAIRWKNRNTFLAHILEFLSRALQCAVRLVIRYTPIGWILNHIVVVSMLFLMHPSSEGRITVHPRDGHGSKKRRRCDVDVKVNPRYLQDGQDLDVLKAAWGILDSHSTPTFWEVFPKPILFFLQLFLPKDVCFRLYCRCFLQPYYHVAGSCGMSQEGKESREDWVVHSSTLQLRGYDGLYVCDASVFPSMISNPPALTCTSLGYHFGKKILADDDN
jgi:GMC oxidoreductase